MKYFVAAGVLNIHLYVDTVSWCVFIYNYIHKLCEACG